MAKSTPSEDRYRFGGFDAPNYTQVPDALFDELMPHLSGAELKVLLYVVRRTFGFKKGADAISLKQMVEGITTRDGRVLDRGTGLSQRAVVNAVKGLVEKDVIVATRNSSAERGDLPTTYAPHMGSTVCKKVTRGGEQSADPRPAKRSDAPLHELPTQETVEQETADKKDEPPPKRLTLDEIEAAERWVRQAGGRRM